MTPTPFTPGGPRLPLPDPRELPDPRKLPVRRLTVADLTACSDLAESRGWGREEHKWRLLLTEGQGYGVDAPDAPGSLIGAFVLTPYGSLAQDGAAGAADGYAAISMVLVAERCERRGLGRRMMTYALAEGAGAVLFLTATENGRPLYEQLGFVPVGRLTTLTGSFTAPDGRPAAATGAATAAVRPATAADMTAVRALDARVFGADRSRLLERLPSFADRFVVSWAADGFLAGFAASWPNTRHTVIGPVVAEDQRTARALVTDLGVHAPGEIRFDVDARHCGLETWLRSAGLTGDRGCTLMIRTAPDLPGDAARRFAPYSVALG